MYLFFAGHIAEGFISYFLAVNADKSPDGERLILPVGLTIEEIFKEYTSKTPDDERIKRSQFYKIYKKNHKNVTHPRVSFLHELLKNQPLKILDQLTKSSNGFYVFLTELSYDQVCCVHQCKMYTGDEDHVPRGPCSNKITQRWTSRSPTVSNTKSNFV